jgi:putative serine protease PepD
MRNFAEVAGIRLRSRIRPDAGGRDAFNLWLRRPVVAAVLAMFVLGVPAAAGLLIRSESINAQALAAQARANQELQSRVDSLEARVNSRPDWTAIVRRVEPSVFTIDTAGGLGSAWAARADASGSDLITNFHVIADGWNAGDTTIDVRQGDQTIKGIVTRVDRNDDLAVVHVAKRFAALPVAAARPELGSTVMAVGSPLGLGGSLSIGVVSGFRSVYGSDYVQFSAPISPGNSGGPVVDGRGRVVAVAAAKFEGSGVEALSLAIPVQTVCTMVVICVESPND